MQTTTKTLMLAFVGLSYMVSAQNLEWVKHMAGTSSEEGLSVTVDASGNVYTTGYFQGTVDFDPGPGIHNLTAVANEDIFISKLDASGNFIWAKQFGGIGSGQGRSIAVDANGNVYTAGYFSETADFDPGPGVFNLSNVSGGTDIYVSKLDASGNFVWAKQMVGPYSGDGANSIAIDGNGNVLITGYFVGTPVDFDPGPGVFNLSSIGSHDIFICKLDASGDFVWAKKIGNIYGDVGYSIAVDKNGNVYTTGYFEDIVDFDPGPGTFNLGVLFHSIDIYVSKLDASGNFVWAKRMGGMQPQSGYSIFVDANENVYTTGYFHHTVDFDPDTGTFHLTSAGYSDIFVSKLDNQGNFVWAKQLGGPDEDIGRSIDLDNNGNIYTTGYFRTTSDFDPGIGTQNLTAFGVTDIFISKLNVLGDFVWAKQLGGPGWDYTFSIDVDNNGDVHTTGSFSGTADFDPNPGTFNLTSLGPPGSVDIFVHKLGECVISSGTQTTTACTSYTWPANNVTYTASGTYTDTITGTLGCDSVVTLYLTINPLPNVTTTTSGITITANQSGATYQWLDCNNGFAVISGATNQSFTATSNGNYAVRVTQNGCTDTSACVNISSVGISDYTFENTIQLYPNPTNGLINLRFDTEKDKIQVVVRNVIGQEVFNQNFTSTRQFSLNMDGQAGLYYVEVITENDRVVLRLAKE